MSCILNIETSTDVCSVSVSQDGACIFSQEDHDGPNHAVCQRLSCSLPWLAFAQLRAVGPMSLQEAGLKGFVLNVSFGKFIDVSIS